LRRRVTSQSGRINCGLSLVSGYLTPNSRLAILGPYVALALMVLGIGTVNAPADWSTEPYVEITNLRGSDLNPIERDLGMVGREYTGLWVRITTFMSIFKTSPSGPPTNFVESLLVQIRRDLIPGRRILGFTKPCFLEGPSLQRWIEPHRGRGASGGVRIN